MLRKMIFRLCLLCVAVLGVAMQPETAEAGGYGQPTDWQRFYNYPYVYYPHNFVAPYQYDHMYYRYPQERRIPVYRKDWHNFYPMDKPYHSGNHFRLDIF